MIYHIKFDKYIAAKNGTKCEVIGRFFKSLQDSFELFGFADILDQSLDIYQSVCQEDQKIDFEDLLQLECALHHGCDTFLTEDRGVHKLDVGIKVVGLEDVLGDRG